MRFRRWVLSRWKSNVNLFRSRSILPSALALWRVSATVVLFVFLASFALAQSSASAEYEVYSLNHKSVEEVEKLLNGLLDDLDVKTHLVADPGKNQILLRGPASAQEIARRLIQSVDRPAVRVIPAKPVLETYPLDRERLEAVAKSLKKRFQGNRGVRIVVDASTSQLLILAPPEIHALIGSSLQPPQAPGAIVKASDKFAKPPGKTAKTAGSAQSQPRELFVSLLNSRIDDLVPMLRRLFGGRLQPVRAVDSEEPVYVLSDVNGQDVEVSVDSRRNRIAVYGPEVAAAQMVRLIRALDSRQEVKGHRVRILAVRRTSPGKVEEAVRAYRGEHKKTKRKKAPRGGRNSRERNDGSGIIQDTEIQPANFAFQDAGETEQTKPNEDPIAEQDVPGSELEQNRERLRELGDNVEVETLPDLDVIILRGRDRDVDEMTRIINEIERLSAEAEPEIEIVHLKHVESQQLSVLMTGVMQDLVGNRQGRVQATPLLKPNAIMLIGWGEALDVIIELIKKLDHPVDPLAQLRVFQLKHAAAATAQQTVQQSFATRPGLAAKVTVTADSRSNSLIVRAAPRDMEEVELLIARLDVEHSGAVNQTKIFRLRNSLAVDVAQVMNQAITATKGGGNAQPSAILELLAVDTEGERIVKSGLLNNVQITPDPGKNTLIVIAPPESMELLGELIRQLDETPIDTAQVKVFRIINGQADDLVRMLRSLLPSQSGANVGPRLSGAEGEASMAPLRFAIDTRTNSIIATGSAGELRIIEALLIRLDEREVQHRKNIVYRLKNVSANDVARAISDFLRSERQIQQAAPGGMSPFKQIEREVVVVPEPVGNNLIVSATPRFFEDIQAIVEKLDEQPPQVMIQVMIAEVVLNNSDEFGIELGLQDSLLFDRSLLSNLADSQTLTSTTQQSTVAGITTQTTQSLVGATLEPGFDFNQALLGNSGNTNALAGAGNIAGQALSNFAIGRTNSQLGYGGLVLSAGSESVNVLLRALHENRRLEVLSRPQVMTLDNQPAWIQVGQRVPRISGSNVGVTGTVNSVTLEDVGLILGVTPRISPDGMVVMEIDSEKSAVGSEADGIPVLVSTDGTVVKSPRIDVVTAQTTVSAADGETIILGGLITKRKEEIARRVPYLSQIPILGNLFRYDFETERRTELLIILTPHVIRSQDDMQRVKIEEYARMSWCATDVCELQNSDPLICGEAGCPVFHDEIPVFYPGFDPSGGSYQPQPQPESVLPLTTSPQSRIPRRSSASQASWDDVEVVYPDSNPQGTASKRPAPRLNQGRNVPQILRSPPDGLLPTFPESTSIN